MTEASNGDGLGRLAEENNNAEPTNWAEKIKIRLPQIPPIFSWGDKSSEKRAN